MRRTPSVALVYIAKDSRDLDDFYVGGVDAAHTELIGIDNKTGLSLSAIGNQMLDRCQAPVFGLCHADAVFLDGALEAFAAEAMAGAICGIVGRSLVGDYISASMVSAPTPVSTLDGMAVFLRPDLGLRFDAKTFIGFHCHVEDLCLQAHARGIAVTIPPAAAHHRNHVTDDSWLHDYRMYRAKLAAKWRGTEFATT